MYTCGIIIIFSLIECKYFTSVYFPLRLYPVCISQYFIVVNIIFFEITMHPLPFGFDLKLYFYIVMFF